MILPKIDLSKTMQQIHVRTGTDLFFGAVLCLDLSLNESKTKPQDNDKCYWQLEK